MCEIKYVGHACVTVVVAIDAVGMHLYSQIHYYMLN